MRHLISLLSLLAVPLAPMSFGSAAEPDLRYEVSPRAKVANIHGHLWLDAKLINQGDSTVVVYWGDRALAKMYLFEVIGPKRESIPTYQYTYRDAPMPVAANRRYFRTLAPGKSLSYAMVLGSTIGANTQWASFAQAGEYAIEPSLHITTKYVMDENVEDLVVVPDVWTGSLYAEPFKLRVSNQLEPRSVAIGGDTTITGQVLDPQGAPLAGATVQSEIRLQGGGYDGWSRTPGPSAKTNKEGRFTLRRLNHGSPDFKLAAHHPKYPLAQQVVVNSGKPKLQAKFQLEEGVELRGVVQMGSGVAMRGVTVSSNGRIAYTNEQGEFTIAAMPVHEKYWVNCLRAGFAAISSEADHKTATGGGWSIAMHRNSHLSGIALLPDGTPLKRARLEFKFRPAGKPDAPARGDRTQADEQGRFRIALPSAGPHDITALAEDSAVERHLPHNAWETLVEHVGPTKEEIVFEFDNNAALQVEVKPTAPMPDAVRLRTTVYRTNLDNHRQPFRKHTFSSKGGATMWRNISPGEYQIEVFVDNSPRYHWQKTVQVGSGGKPRRVLFELPELEFGQLEGQVFLPDGKPGAISLWYDSTRGHGSIRSDAKGHFDLPLVSAGKLWVASREDRYLGRASTNVPAGGVGRIELRLQDREKTTGVVKGKVSLADGTPLVGVSTDEFPIGVQRPAVEPGAYQVRLGLGEKYFSIHLSRSTAWLAATGRKPAAESRRFGSRPHESITTKVEVAPGVTRHDVTLPDKFTDLVVRIKDRDPKSWWNLEVCSDLAEEPRAFRYRRLHYLSSVRDEPNDNSDASPEIAKIKGLPTGSTFVIARQEGVMLWKKVPPGKTEVTLESSHVGRLEFALMNQRGQALKNGALRLEAVDLPDATFIWAAERDQADKRPRRDKSAMVDARGITKFSPISAGAYRVYAAEAFSGDEWQWNEPQQISLRAGETLQLRAQWNNGKIVWLDNPFPNRPD